MAYYSFFTPILSYFHIERRVIQKDMTGSEIFRSDGSYIYLKAPYAEFYIPMYYFDTTRRFAEDLNDRIQCLGLFNVGIFKDGKLVEMKTLNLPTMIQVFVYDSEIREVTLSNGETMQCRVIKYLKDAKVMQSGLFDDSGYATEFLKYITGGNLPSIIPYSKANEIWYKNQSLNGVNFGVSSLYLELVLSVMFRNPNDMSQKFAKIASNPGVSDYAYENASIRQVCQYNSTFTALTFEDIDSMITTSLNKSRDKVKEQESPVEQIIKF